MNEIVRYKLVQEHRGLGLTAGAEMMPSNTGEWVRYDDHVAELAALRETHAWEVTRLRAAAYPTGRDTELAKKVSILLSACKVAEEALRCQPVEFEELRILQEALASVGE